jgi:hypothetical protein
VVVATLKAALRPVQDVPSLWRFNGSGTAMLGRYYDPRLEPKFYSLVFFTFCMIPICPLGDIYLVWSNGNSYVFYAEISRRDFNAIYKFGYAKLIWNGIAETLFVFTVAIAVVAGIIFLLHR